MKGYVAGALLLQTARAQLPAFQFPQAGAGALPPLSLPALSPLPLPSVGGVIPPGTDDVVLPEATPDIPPSAVPAVSLDILPSAQPALSLPVLPSALPAISIPILPTALPDVSLPVLSAADTGVQFGPTILPNIRSLAGALASAASSAVRGLVVPTLPVLGPPQPAITPGGFGAFAIGDEGTPTPPEDPVSDALDGLTEPTPVLEAPTPVLEAPTNDFDGVTNAVPLADPVDDATTNDFGGVTDTVPVADPVDDATTNDADTPFVAPLAPIDDATNNDAGAPFVDPLAPIDDATILPAAVDTFVNDPVPINDTAAPAEAVPASEDTPIGDVAAPVDDITPLPVDTTVAAPVGDDPFAGVAPVAGSTDELPVVDNIEGFQVPGVADGTVAPTLTDNNPADGSLETPILPVAALGDATAASALGLPIIDDLGTVGATESDVSVADGTDPSLSTDLPVGEPIFDPANNFPTAAPEILPVFTNAEALPPLPTPEVLPLLDDGSFSAPLTGAVPDQGEFPPPQPEDNLLPAVDDGFTFEPPQVISAPVQTPIDGGFAPFQTPVDFPLPLDLIDVVSGPADGTPIQVPTGSDLSEEPLPNDPNDPNNNVPIEAPIGSDPTEGSSPYDPNDPNSAPLDDTPIDNTPIDSTPIEVPTGSSPFEGEDPYGPNSPFDPSQPQNLLDPAQQPQLYDLLDPAQQPQLYDPIQQQNPYDPSQQLVDSAPYNPFTGANDGPYVPQSPPVGPSGYDGSDNSVYDGEGFSSGGAGGLSGNSGRGGSRDGGSHGGGGPHRGQEADPTTSYSTDDTTEYDGEDYGSGPHGSSKSSGKKPTKGNGPPDSGYESDSDEECPEWCLEDDSSSTPKSSFGDWASSTVSSEYPKETGGKKHKKKKSKKAKKPKSSHRIAVSVDDNVVYTNEYRREVADDAPSSGGGFSGFVWPSKKTDGTATSADNSDSAASESSKTPAASASSSQNFDKEISDQLQKGSNGQRVQPDLETDDSSSGGSSSGSADNGSDSGDGVSGSTLPDWLSDLQKPKESGASENSSKKESSGKPTGSFGGSENDAPKETSKSSKKKKAKGKCPKRCKNKKHSASGSSGGKPSETGFGGKPSETGGFSGEKPSETGSYGDEKPSEAEAGGKTTEAPSGEGEKPTGGAPAEASSVSYAEETPAVTNNSDFGAPTTLLTLASPKPDEPTDAPAGPPANAAPTDKPGFTAGDVSSGDTFTGSTLDGVCPKQCNPFNPTENICDHESSGCTTAGGSKYYCACRAGFKLGDGANKDFSKQFKVPGQPYVFVWPGAKCDKQCDSGLCDEVLVRDQCV
ncbi:hypothetical protein PMIN07_003637 [Paraphaeosphaeria minitans]